MCGIALTRYKNINKILERQEDRGMDSLGVMNLSHNIFYKWVNMDLKEYQGFVDRMQYKDGLCLVHHRKASIGSITMNNCHPFFSSKFTLMQNGTMKAFYEKHKNTYKKETDSETLLALLDDKCDDITEVIAELDKSTATLGILMIVDKKQGKVLIYSDGFRESYVQIQNGYLKNYLNYDPSLEDAGYKNIGYVVIDLEGKILEKRFEKKLNTVEFATKYTYVPSATPTRSYNYNYGQGVLPVVKDDVDNEDVRRNEMYAMGLTFWTVKVLIREGIDTFADLCSVTEAELEVIDDLYTYNLNEIKNLFSKNGMSMAQPADDFPDEDKELTELYGDDYYDYLNVIEGNTKTSSQDNGVGVDDVDNEDYKEEPFYSEEILASDELLTADMACYVLRTEHPSIDGYGYEMMGIGNSIKKEVGKSTWKRMKKLYKLAVNKATLAAFSKGL